MFSNLLIYLDTRIFSYITFSRFTYLFTYFFLDTKIIALLFPVTKEVGGLTNAFMLLSMLHGVCLKESGKTLFGMTGKDTVKL